MLLSAMHLLALGQCFIPDSFTITFPAIFSTWIIRMVPRSRVDAAIQFTRLILFMSTHNPIPCILYSMR